MGFNGRLGATGVVSAVLVGGGTAASLVLSVMLDGLGIYEAMGTYLACDLFLLVASLLACGGSLGGDRRRRVW